MTRVGSKALLAPQPRGCAFGNATEFCPRMSMPAKDKIRLLIQKLEDKCVRPACNSMPHKTQIIHAKCGLDAMACYKVIIAKDIGSLSGHSAVKFSAMAKLDSTPYFLTILSLISFQVTSLIFSSAISFTHLSLVKKLKSCCRHVAP